MKKNLLKIIMPLIITGIFVNSSFSKGLIGKSNEKYSRAWRAAIETEYTKDSKEYCPNKDNLKGVDEGDFDYFQTPEETEQRGKGDCEDMSFHLYKEMKKDGLKPRVVVGITQKNGYTKQICHAWVELSHDEKNLIFDPSDRIFGDRIELNIKYGLRFYEFSDEKIEKSYKIRKLINEVEIFVKKIDTTISSYNYTDSKKISTRGF